MERGGKINVISSPRLVKDDADALADGYEARDDEVKALQLAKEFESMLHKPYLEKPSLLLAYLVANGVVEFKTADPHTSSLGSVTKRIFHDKLGIFTDAEGESVVFKGSMNETYYGLSDDGNIESVDVFCSFRPSSEGERVRESINHFALLWENQYPGVQVHPFPESALSIIRRNAPETYSEFTDILDELKKECDRIKPMVTPGKTPRPHQQAVIDNWYAKGRRGVIKHATGSGKTFTALCCIRDALEHREIPIILVPSNALLSQWEHEIKKEIQNTNILQCGDSNNAWRTQNLLVDFSSTYSKADNRLILSTIQTARSDDFLQRLRHGPHLFLVADEVHRMGSTEHRKIMEKLDCGARLGLSATPERFGDKEGTEAIFDFFGECLSPEFSLREAIEEGVLTPYYYYPSHVRLTEEEQEVWNDYTEKLSRLAAQIRQESNPERLARLRYRFKRSSIDRARVAKKAVSKVKAAVDIVSRKFVDQHVWLIYCEDTQQMDEVYHGLQFLDMLPNGVAISRYFSDMDGDRRRETLEYFKRHSGIIVSIRCLDEGVDIPSATHALFLASSKNPREHVQRRGRILRKAPRKTYSVIFDVLALPNEINDKNSNTNEEDIVDSLVAGEIARGISFAEWAKNRADAEGRLKDMAISIGLDPESIVKFSEGEEGDNDDGI
jgi:superfamily II DNA or RNA helicase